MPHRVLPHQIASAGRAGGAAPAPVTRCNPAPTACNRPGPEARNASGYPQASVAAYSAWPCRTVGADKISLRDVPRTGYNQRQFFDM